MTHRRQFLQAAAVTPFALGAVPYVRVKPSWYLEPKDRIDSFKVGEKYYTNDFWTHRRTMQKHSPQDPSVDWSTSTSVTHIVECLLRRFDPFFMNADFPGDTQRAKILASSFWDFGADLNEPVPVSVNRGIEFVTVADLLEWQDLSKHPKLQYTQGPMPTRQEIFEYNGFQHQPFKVGDVVHRGGSYICFDVMEVDGSELWLSIGSHGSKPEKYNPPCRQPRGMHVPDTSNWWVVPETIPSKGHKLRYGDCVLPTLAAHRRLPWLKTRDGVETPFGLVMFVISDGLDTTLNIVSKRDTVFESDELIYLGHDPWPMVIYDEIEGVT